MFAHFKADDIEFTASDDISGSQNIERNIPLHLNFTELQEQKNVFNKLAEGGKVTFPLEDAFWGAVSGSLIDKYGIQWRMDCYKITFSPLAGKQQEAV